MRVLVALVALTGCYRNDATTPAAPPPVVTTAPDAAVEPPAPIEQPAAGDNRLYASLSKPERIAFCEQETLGTHNLSIDDARLGACRLKALPELVSRSATAAQSRQRCQKSVDDCVAEPFTPDDCKTDEEKECPGITVGDYRGCWYEMRRELKYAAAEDLCATMDPFDREAAFSRRDAVRDGAACMVVRTKCGSP